MHTFDMHRRQLATKQGMDAAVAGARVLARNDAHAFCTLRILRPPPNPRPVAEARVTQVAQRTATTQRQSPRRKLLDRFPALLRARYCFASTSFITSTSRSRSASRRLRRAFSCSSSRRRVIAATSTPPYVFRHVSERVLSTAMRAAHATNCLFAGLGRAQDLDDLLLSKRTGLHRMSSAR